RRLYQMAQSIPPPDRTPEYWRKHAEEARARADEMGGFEGRDIMLEIAALYDDMAVRAEREGRHAGILGGYGAREGPEQRQARQQQAQQPQAAPSDKKDKA